MLKGTPEELEYHAQRAAAELALAEGAAAAAAEAHRALATLHSNRAELVSAMRDRDKAVEPRAVYRTDKEG